MPAKKNAKENPFLMYKGQPLVRCGNIIYYGDMSKKYIIMMQVLSSHDKNGLEVADRVLVQLQYTDTGIKSRDRTIKKTEKDGLYDAIDIAAIWLERALSEN
jgi:hypothetical protein